jgi:predicted TIM-barrel fold metal-dependent hydrolase
LKGDGAKKRRSTGLESNIIRQSKIVKVQFEGNTRKHEETTIFDIIWTFGTAKRMFFGQNSATFCSNWPGSSTASNLLKHVEPVYGTSESWE